MPDSPLTLESYSAMAAAAAARSGTSSSSSGSGLGSIPGVNTNVQKAVDVIAPPSLPNEIRTPSDYLEIANKAATTGIKSTDIMAPLKPQEVKLPEMKTPGDYLGLAAQADTTRKTAETANILSTIKAGTVSITDSTSGFDWSKATPDPHDPSMVIIDGLSYYRPGTTPYEMGFRTHADVGAAQQTGAQYGPYSGSMVDKESTVMVKALVYNHQTGQYEQQYVRFSSTGGTAEAQRSRDGLIQLARVNAPPEEFNKVIGDFYSGRMSEADYNKWLVDHSTGESPGFLYPVGDKWVKEGTNKFLGGLSGEGLFTGYKALGLIPSGAVFLSAKGGMFSYKPDTTPAEAAAMGARAQFQSFINSDGSLNLGDAYVKGFTDRSLFETAGYAISDEDWQKTKDYAVSLKKQAEYNTALKEVSPYMDFTDVAFVAKYGGSNISSAPPTISTAGIRQALAGGVASKTLSSLFGADFVAKAVSTDILPNGHTVQEQRMKDFYASIYGKGQGDKYRGYTFQGGVDLKGNLAPVSLDEYIAQRSAQDSVQHSRVDFSDPILYMSRNDTPEMKAEYALWKSEKDATAKYTSDYRKDYGEGTFGQQIGASIVGQLGFPAVERRIQPGGSWAKANLMDWTITGVSAAMVIAPTVGPALRGMNSYFGKIGNFWGSFKSTPEGLFLEKASPGGDILGWKPTTAAERLFGGTTKLGGSGKINPLELPEVGPTEAPLTDTRVPTPSSNLGKGVSKPIPNFPSKSIVPSPEATGYTGLRMGQLGGGLNPLIPEIPGGAFLGGVKSPYSGEWAPGLSGAGGGGIGLKPIPWGGGEVKPWELTYTGARTTTGPTGWSTTEGGLLYPRFGFAPLKWVVKEGKAGFTVPPSVIPGLGADGGYVRIPTLGAKGFSTGGVVVQSASTSPSSNTVTGGLSLPSGSSLPGPSTVPASVTLPSPSTVPGSTTVNIPPPTVIIPPPPSPPPPQEIRITSNPPGTPNISVSGSPSGGRSRLTKKKRGQWLFPALNVTFSNPFDVGHPYKQSIVKARSKTYGARELSARNLG